ncbi:unnamed protein product [Musa banksii]
MESTGAWDLSSLLRLLAQGEEQARQLEAHLEAPSLAEHCKSLLQRVRSTLEEAISMAKLVDYEMSRQPACHNAIAEAAAAAASDSPRSNSGSPRSESSERVFKEHERMEMCKKRKTLPKWTNQVRVSSGGVTEGLEDGYSWRKYGQKEILGARHPRGYYRCSHRNSVGCLATKQVQRSDQDPCVFDITYRGEHTCLQRPQPSPLPEPELQQSHENPPTIHEALLHHPRQHLQSSLRVETEGLNMHDQVLSSSFSFPSTPLDSFGPQSRVFSSTNPLENTYVGSFSPFISPTTSESNYFSVSPCQMSGYGGGIAPNTSESDLTEIISAATSTTNSPKLDAAFMLDHAEFDQIFPFDAPKFF